VIAESSLISSYSSGTSTVTCPPFGGVTDQAELTTTLQYDGSDGGSTTINYQGLNLNLLTTGEKFRISATFSGFGLSYLLGVNIYSRDGTSCTYGNSATSGSSNYEIPWNSFTGNCDMTSVGALELVTTITTQESFALSTYTIVSKSYSLKNRNSFTNHNFYL